MRYGLYASPNLGFGIKFVNNTACVLYPNPSNATYRITNGTLTIYRSDGGVKSFSFSDYGSRIILDGETFFHEYE